MPNTSSSFLDVEGLIDEKPEDQLPLFDFTEEIKAEEFARTRAAARWSRQFDPEAYAKAAKIAPEIPPEVGVRQLELLEDASKLAEYQKIFENAPTLRAHFATNPKDLAFANPDELDNISGLEWIAKAGPAASAEGMQMLRAAWASNRVAAGTATIQDRAFLANYEPGRTFGARGFWDEAFVATAQQIAPLVGTGLGALRGALQGSVYGGTAGAVAGSVLPAVGTLAGGTAGAAMGARVGATYGALEFQRQIQTGLSRLEFQRIRDENGKELDPALVELAANITGLGGAALEQIALERVVSVIPGADRLVGLFTKEGFKQALQIPTVRAALTNFARNIATTGAVEIGTEVMQQALQIAAEEVVKANSEGAFEQRTPTEVAEELAQAGYQAFQVMALMGPFVSSTRLAADLVAARQSETEHKKLEDMVAHIQDNKLVQRAPEVAARAIDSQMEERKLSVPAEEMRALFQEDGRDVTALPLPNWRVRIEEALATGGEVEITYGEFLAHLATDPRNTPLMDLVRTDPTQFNKLEIEQMRAELDSLIQSELARAQAVGPLPTDVPLPTQIQVSEVHNRLATEIEATGFKPDAARNYATALSSFYEAMGARVGKTADELAAQYPLKVQREREVRNLIRNANEEPQDLDFDEPDERDFDDLYQEPQKGAGLTRGAINFNEEGATISLFEAADMSTLLHEAGHFYLQTFRDMALQEPTLAADWEILRKHLKIKDDNLLTREQHEKFARMTEAYFMEGKAPSPELRSVFEIFRSWLKTVYKNIRALGGRVNPEIAGVFDRMLVAERRLAELEANRAYEPLFRDAGAMGVSPEEYLEYQKLVEDLRTESQEKVRSRVIGKVEKFQKGWRKEILKQITRETEEKLRKQPPYSHIALMNEGRLTIDPKALSEKYGAEASKKFPRKGLRANGLHPDVAAELLGYPTADEMVYDFVQAMPIKEAAAELAKQEMERRYGDALMDPGNLDVAIKRELAAEGRLNILAKEYAALRTKDGKTADEVSPRQLAKQIARNTIYRRKAKDLNERQAQSAANRAATAAEQAALKGEWAKAADWKRKQLLAQALDNEIQEANRVIEKIRDKAARYTRTAPKGIDPSTMAQIRELVTQYDFARISGKKLRRRESLREYIEQATAEGLVLNVPDRLLRDAGKVNWKELPVEDLIGLGDTLDNLEHIGRLKNKLRTAQGLREWQEVQQEVLDSLKKLPKKKRKQKHYGEEEQKWYDTALAFHASVLKPEQIIEWLDAGDVAGPMMQYVFQPIVEAQNQRNELNLQYNEKLVKIFDKIPGSYLSEGVAIKSLNTVMTREQLYAVALNTGNESNRTKLLEGELWTETQLEDILSHLTVEDWNRVQQVWDLLDGLWEKVAALEKKLTGVTPPKVEAMQFTNQHGTFRGGYYPVVYDFKGRRGLNLLEDTTPADRHFGADGLFSNEFIRPGTNHKHTVARTKVAKPIRLHLSVLPGHIHNVIHDLTHREAVRSAYKVLWDPEIKRAIEDAESEQVYSQLQHWLRQVASERAHETDELTKPLRHLRTGMTFYGMGFRISTALMQPLGLFTSLTKVKARYLLSGVYQMTRHPIATVNMVNGLSGEMKGRFNAQDRDIKDTVKKISLKDSKLDRIRRYSFAHIAYADRYTSTATWLGAYQQYLDEHPGAQDLAIQHADRTVRLSQGTGSAKDMAKIANNGEMQKLFTMFYSFFSAQYNMQVDLTRKTKRDIADGDWETLFMERLPQWTYLVVLPAVISSLLVGQGPEEDESKALWFAKTVGLYGLAGVPFIRDIASMAEGFEYKMSPIARFVESGGRAVANLIEGDLPGMTKPAAEAVSIGFRLPTGQAISTIDGLWRGLENGDLEVTDLIYGRRGK